jgi:tubulin---tyrosine ligase
MPCEQTIKKKQTQSNEVKIYNKIEDNFHISNKKALYLNMKNYYEALNEDVFDYLPLTFHLKQGVKDPEF